MNKPKLTTAELLAKLDKIAAGLAETRAKLDKAKARIDRVQYCLDNGLAYRRIHE